MTWQDCRDTIRDLSRLKPDWDGRGAAVPLKCALRRTLVLLDLLERLDAFEPTRIVAAPDGSVSVEWQRKGELRLIEIEVAEQCRITYAFDEGFEHGTL